MMLCEIYAVPGPDASFEWKWRQENGAGQSLRSFNLYFECVQDARKNGGVVNLRKAVSETHKNMAWPAGALNMG
jgi:hypothetical protein